MSVANGSAWMVGVLLVGVWTFLRDVGPAAGQPSTTKSTVVDERVHAHGPSMETGEPSNHRFPAGT
jgi:hypothetical protein